MACPLCDSARSQPSWLGSTFYQGKQFPYLECTFCQSLYCEPMPDDDTLGQMYGPDYGTSFDADQTIYDSKEPVRAIEWLKKLKPASFLDYGCGAGSMLIEAKKLDVQVLGVEFDDEVVRAVGKQTGAKVMSHTQANALDNPLADVLYLGDVIEHLTKMNRQMPEILKLINPGGVLMAQGPLEANATLFTRVLRLTRRLRPSRRTEMAPYHVLLATAKGQRILFKRFGLEELEFSISEVAWPAPNKLSLSNLKQPRLFGLFLLRRASQAISALRADQWGNRYFYVGRWKS